MTDSSGFAHQRLDVFHAAMDLAVGVEQLTARFPRGQGDLKDQVRRAASATMRNIVEGANRWSSRDKAARFVIARGECGECDATLEMIERLGLGCTVRVRELRFLADRIAAMLTKLIRRSREA